MSNQLTTTREERGQEIVKLNGQIKRIDDCTYTVKSQSNNGEYCITKVDGEYVCECLDNKYRHVKCKHIFAVEFSQSFRAEVAISRVISEMNIQNCQYCDSSDIVKNAVRHNKCGDIQRYVCKSCGKRFSINIGFEKMRATPQVITSAMQLYFTGESYRNVQKFLRLQGVEVDHSTVLRWVRKYVRLMESYVEKMKPNVSDTWRADELYLKVKGNMKYLFAMMDDETRFWIAQEMADHKGTSDVRPMFRAARERAGKKPKTLISDGAANFGEANTKEWWTMKKATRTEHIRHIRLAGDVH